MGKRRAYELIKELGIEFDELTTIADKAGVVIKNKMAGVQDDEVDKIMQVIEQAKSEQVVEKRVAKGVIRRRAVVRKAKAVPKPVVEEPSVSEEETDEVDSSAEMAVTESDTSEEQATEVATEQLDESVDSSEEEPSDSEQDSTEPTEAETAEATEAVEQVQEPEPVEPPEVAPVSEEAPKPEPEKEEAAAQVTSEDEAQVESVEEEKSEPVAEQEAKPEAEAAAEPKKKTKADKKAKADTKESAEETKEEPKKRKPKKTRTISTIVKRIDLDDLEPAQRTPLNRRRPGPGGGRPQQRPGASSNAPSRSASRNNVMNGPVEIAPPIMDGGRRRGKDFGGGDPFSRDDRRKRGKGTRKRQVIDDSYLNRRGRGGKGKRGRYVEDEFVQTQITVPKASKRIIKLATDTIIVSELAKRMGIKATAIIKALIQMGLQVNMNQAIDLDTAMLVANDFGYEVENVAFEEDQILSISEQDDSGEMLPRSPVVTVMGHVDHGKTSILDYIRKANVAGGEAGGITQHIGAYVVRRSSGSITFIDTPGHEAFTSMRARGAQVTDIVVLVVAADDGIMPQTIEAINHAKAAKVPIIVAINKIDKPNANSAHVRQQLMMHELIPEDLGGDTIIVEVSAKTGQNIDQLLEMILLQAEVLELQANPKREQGEGIVIEGKLDRGRGPVGTVLVQQGTFRVGDYFVSGAQTSKIKAMIDDLGQRVEEAGPATPVEILGFNEVPTSGEMFNTLKDEKQAKMIAENRYRKKREQELAKTSRVSLEELVQRAKEGELTTLSLVVKGDVQGTVEALRDTLEKESSDEVKVDIISTGVGGITESDVLFASASKALIVGFNVRAESKAQVLAESEGVEIRNYSVIYDVVEDIRAVVLGLAAPKLREEVVGHIDVRETFTIPKIGTIAGSYILDGKVHRDSQVRLLRDNVVIYTGKIGSLRRFKEDVAEVASGFECGVGIDGYNDVHVGDKIEVFRTVEVPPSAKLPQNIG